MNEWRFTPSDDSGYKRCRTTHEGNCLPPSTPTISAQKINGQHYDRIPLIFAAKAKLMTVTRQ